MPLTKQQLVPDTGAQTSVAYSAADTTILAASNARIGACIWNDATVVLYLLLASGTASSTNYTVQLAAGAYYEVPFGYLGIIKGIWAGAGAGNARVTSFS